MKGIIEYLTPEQLEQIREFRRVEADAKQELQRLQKAARDAQAELASAATIQRTSPRAAAARFLGESAEREQKPKDLGRDSGYLRDALQGLQARIQGAETELARCREAARLAVVGLLEKAAERMAEAYASLAEELHTVHVQLAAANDVVVSAHGGHGWRHWLVAPEHWRKLVIPGDDIGRLPALRKATTIDAVGPVLHAGTEDLGRIRAAAQQLETEMVATVGYWPLARG